MFFGVFLGSGYSGSFWVEISSNMNRSFFLRERFRYRSNKETENPPEVQHASPERWNPGIVNSFWKFIIFRFHVKLGECLKKLPKKGEGCGLAILRVFT